MKKLLIFMFLLGFLIPAYAGKFSLVDLDFGDYKLNYECDMGRDELRCAFKKDGKEIKRPARNDRSTDKSRHLPTLAQSGLIRINYGAWTINYNCDKRSYENFHYVTVPDTGSLDRYAPFHVEKRLPADCRQKSTKSYYSKHSKIKYDRGHGVHQNIWDHDEELMVRSNLFSNITPQASLNNRRGTWRKTEELTECWREHGEVEVWGGVYWGDDKSNDIFLKSHGVVTADYLWKVIKFPNGEVNAWFMPNDNTPTAARMDSYLVSPKRVSNLTGVEFKGVSRSEMSEKDSHSMRKPRGCSLK